MWNSSKQPILIQGKSTRICTGSSSKLQITSSWTDHAHVYSIPDLDISSVSFVPVICFLLCILRLYFVLEFFH